MDEVEKRWMREGLWRVLCLGLSWRAAAAAAMGAAEEDWDRGVLEIY